MKTYLSILFILLTTAGFAQSKEELQVLSRAHLLHKTVFGTKDSSTLEDLFAKNLSYGHSGGNVQTREEAIRGISHNKSAYTDTSLNAYTVYIGDDDVAIVRYVMRETETKDDGKSAPLNLAIMTVWIKEKGKWKLFGRQAVKIQ
jgi:hypothetical protein